MGVHFNSSRLSHWSPNSIQKTDEIKYNKHLSKHNGTSFTVANVLLFGVAVALRFRFNLKNHLGVVHVGEGGIPKTPIGTYLCICTICYLCMSNVHIVYCTTIYKKIAMYHCFFF